MAHDRSPKHRFVFQWIPLCLVVVCLGSQIAFFKRERVLEREVAKERTSSTERQKKAIASEKARKESNPPAAATASNAATVKLRPSEWDNWTIVDPRTEFPHQPPDVPAPKLGFNGHPTPPFITTHLWFLEEIKKQQPDLVFLGDSITEGWLHNPAVWASAFGKYHPFNLGIGGDRTQHVLWRIENGELDGQHPKVAVVLIGTNNLFSDSPQDIANGVTAVVTAIRKKSQTTKVILLAIFPRGERPNEARAKAEAVNSIISKLDDGHEIRFLDLSSNFLRADQTLDREVMPDFLHPSAKGYEIWAEGMCPLLTELMN